MKRAFWTPEQDAELQALFATMTSREVATKLGRSLCAVENRIRRLSGERKSTESLRSDPLPEECVSKDSSAAGKEAMQRATSAASSVAPAVPTTGQAPAVHTSKSRAPGHVVIPDPQAPFHKQGARAFIERVRREFSVPLDNMMCAGDEVDAYFGSRFDHSPDATHTPNSEIAAVLDEMKEWYALWPKMKLATSNHGMRWVKKALSAQIPSQLLRAYREVLQAPEGWQWADTWRIDGGRQHFMLEHGHNGPQGWMGLRQRPLQNGISTVFGHQHANAGIAHVVTAGQRVWGMCVGSLIDVDAYAFEYDKGNTFKPWVGVGVILDGGKIPLLVPYG